MNSMLSQIDVEKLDFNNIKTIKNMMKLLYNITGSLYQTNQKLRQENEELKDKMTRFSEIEFEKSRI